MAEYIGTLRSVFASGEPSPLLWSRCWEVLEWAWAEDRVVVAEALVPFVLGQVRAWPEGLRVLPERALLDASVRDGALMQLIDRIVLSAWLANIRSRDTSPGHFSEHAPGVLAPWFARAALSGVRSLVLDHVGEEEARALETGVMTLRALELELYYRSGWDAALMARVFRAPPCRALEQVRWAASWRTNSEEAEAVLALIIEAHQRGPGLRSLSLEQVPLRVQDVARLAGAGVFSGLEQLTIIAAGLDDEALEILAAQPCVVEGALRHLDLSSNPIGREVGGALHRLLAGHALVRLDTLRLKGVMMAPEVAMEVATNAALRLIPTRAIVAAPAEDPAAQIAAGLLGCSSSALSERGIPGHLACAAAARHLKVRGFSSMDMSQQAEAARRQLDAMTSPPDPALLVERASVLLAAMRGWQSWAELVWLCDALCAVDPEEVVARSARIGEIIRGMALREEELWGGAPGPLASQAYDWAGTAMMRLVRRVCLDDTCDVETLRGLIDSPHCAHVEVVVIRAQAAWCLEMIAEMLASARHLPALEVVLLELKPAANAANNVRSLAPLFAEDAACTLRVFGVRCPDVCGPALARAESDWLLAQLGAAPWLGSLRRLTLGGVTLSATARGLCGASMLRALALEQCALERGCGAVFDAGQWASLEQVRLDAVDVSPDDLGALVDGPLCDARSALELCRLPWTDAALERLAVRPVIAARSLFSVISSEEGAWMSHRPRVGVVGLWAMVRAGRGEVLEVSGGAELREVVLWLEARRERGDAADGEWARRRSIRNATLVDLARAIGLKVSGRPGRAWLFAEVGARLLGGLRGDSDALARLRLDAG